jgi:alanine racemase
MRKTIAEINAKYLIDNLRSIKAISGNSMVMAIVKANAYGHGMIQCSQVLEANGVDFFGVAFTSEGIRLRESGIKKPILVLVPPTDDEIADIVNYDLQVILNSMRINRLISAEAIRSGKKAQAHLFVNTGMNRDGIRPEEVVDFAGKINELAGIEICGLCTHFASSDDVDCSFTLKQLEVFKGTINKLSSEGFSFKYIHAANSAAVIGFKESCFNLVRPGLALYGYNLSRINTSFELKPVLTLKSSIHKILDIKKDETVGYSQKYISNRDTKIAAIPIGYGDGYPYRLTNLGECIINGKRFKIIGSVCMDQLMIEIGEAQVVEGDEVIFIGKLGNESISAVDIANKIGTIPYEILTGITERVPRVIVEK